MNMPLIPLPIKGNIYGQWSAQIDKVFSWLTALLLAGMTFHLWKGLVLLAFEKLYEILIMGHY